MKKLLLIILAVLMLSGCATATTQIQPLKANPFDHEIDVVVESEEYQVRCFIANPNKSNTTMSCVPLTPQQ